MGNFKWHYMAGERRLGKLISDSLRVALRVVLINFDTVVCQKVTGEGRTVKENKTSVGS